MGSLKQKLEVDGSVYTSYDGSTPSVNPLATVASNMHATQAGGAGYSLNGSEQSTVQNGWAQYNDGAVNLLPAPSNLDINGNTPPTYQQQAPLGSHF
jgi:hypothetical protein